MKGGVNVKFLQNVTQKRQEALYLETNLHRGKLDSLFEEGSLNFQTLLH
jgi:hypothetical protein